MVKKKSLKGLSLSSFAQPKGRYLDPERAQQVERGESSAEPLPPAALLPEALGEKNPNFKPVAVNVKILKHQQDWLRDTAQKIRDNNDEAVPACDRVYPQHLIQVAIDMLRAADVDWAEVRNADELRRRLHI